MKKRNLLVILYLLPIMVLVTVSCSEGIFNFSEETGNLSLSFDVESTAGEDLDKIVFNLNNNDSGDSIRKELSLSSGSYDVNCYISRIDTGPWKVSATVYLSDGTVAAERNDEFRLQFAETVIADYSFWSDGTNRGIDASWEVSGGEPEVSMVSIDETRMFLSAYHTAAASSDSIKFTTSIFCQGSGFETGLDGIKLTFPDQSIFSYTAGSRLVSELEITTTSSLLTINCGEFLSSGSYTLTLTDLNNIEVSSNLYFDLGFDPAGSTAIITTPISSGTNILYSADYDKQDSSSMGTYIIYNVVAGDGTIVNNGSNPNVYEDPAGIGNLDMTSIYITTGVTIYIVLATVDADLSQTDINNVFVSGTTNLLPEKLAGWLYYHFPEQVHYVGISVGEYTP